MPYTITLSDGVTTLITVPDNTILGPLEINAPSQCSLNLVGRGSVNYGLATATNFVWMLQNFASSNSPVSPLAGQLWYNTASPAKLQLYNSSGQWVQVLTSDVAITLNQPLTLSDGLGDQTIIGDNGTITLIRPDSTARITFETALNSTSAAILEYGSDQNNHPDLTISSPAYTTPGYIFHSQNLTPFDLNADNQTVNGTGNIFSEPTVFRQINVSNSNDTNTGDPSFYASYSLIRSGFIDLQTVNTITPPALTLHSNISGSTANAGLNFIDAAAGAPGYGFSMQYYTGGSNSQFTGGLIFNPTTVATDFNGLHTVWHTGNLPSPIVQNPPNGTNQTIVGNLTISGPYTLNVPSTTTVGSLIAGNNQLINSLGGSFTGSLSVNGSQVLTTASSLPYLPLTGGTVTGNLTASNGFYLTAQNNNPPFINFQSLSLTHTGTIYQDITTNDSYTPIRIAARGDNNFPLEVRNNGDVVINGTNLFIQGTAGNSYLNFSSSQAEIYYNDNASTLNFINGGGNIVMDSSGNINGILGISTQNITASSNTSTNTLYVSGGALIENGLYVYGTATMSNNFVAQGLSCEFTSGLSILGSSSYAGRGNQGLYVQTNLQVDGAINCNGNITAYSDERLKSDILTIENALGLVGKLRGVSYTRIADGKRNIGVIAQEVQKIVPEIVHESEDGMLSVAYGNALALCINAINELKARIEELEAK